MGSEWQEATLGDILTLQRGFDLPRNDRQGGSVPVIASTGVVGYHNKAKVNSPGVVIGRSGSLGGGQFIETDFWPLNTTLWVKDFKKNNVRFCYYLLKSIDLAAFNAGSGVPTLNRNHIHPLPVKKPPLSEQRAIAHILGSLDDKIELNHRMNQTLEAMARAIFKSWFVDFDPVCAKAEGRPTDLPNDIAALFPDSFEDSELGEIPKGWKVKNFEKFVTPRNERVEDRDIPEYSSTNEGLFPRPDKFKKQLSKSKAKTKIIRKNDIVFGLSRQILNFGIMKDAIGAVSPAYHVFSIDTSTIFSDFVEQYMRERMHLFYGILGASSREGQSISVQQFYRTGLLIPPKIIQIKLKKSTSVFYSFVEHNKKEISTLASIRDTLLPKLISGVLRVPDAEKFIKEAGI